MAFKTKVDYFGLTGSLAGLACVSNADGKTASVAEAADEAGTIVANTVYGETAAPSSSYVVKAAIAATAGTIGLGTASASAEIGAPVVLSSVTISTSAGSAPTVEASGEMVETGADQAQAPCIYPLPEFNLGSCHHAQILFSAFTLAGAGCYLQSANYTASVTVTKAEKDGACLAHDVSGGKIEAAVSILQTGAEAPVLTVGTGWVVTSPLACDNPDAAYPTWTATLTHYLARS